jgi:hypothetical protein
VKKFITIVAFLLLFILVACQMSPERQKQVGEVLTQLLKDGVLTQDQFNILMQAISGGDFLGELAKIGGAVASAILANLGITRWWRGSINSRKGNNAPSG